MVALVDGRVGSRVAPAGWLAAWAEGAVSLLGVGCWVVLASHRHLPSTLEHLFSSPLPLPSPLTPPKMFARSVRPALTAARTANQQQKAGMATLKEIDQRYVESFDPSTKSSRLATPTPRTVNQRPAPTERPTDHATCCCRMILRRWRGTSACRGANADT